MDSNKMKSSLLIISLWLISCMACEAQTGKWSFNVGMAYIHPNGEYFAIRPNGKEVRTNIEASLGAKFGLSRQLTRRSKAELSFISFSKHRMIIHQDFPDGTQFQSSDIIKPTAIILSYGYRLIDGKIIRVDLNADLSYLIYNNINFESAGPPFDRTLPLEIDVSNNFRGGFHFNSNLFLSQKLRLQLMTGLLINRLQGTFETENDNEPFSDVDLPFNPIFISLGLEFFF